MPQPATGGSSVNRDLGAKIDPQYTLSFVAAKTTANGTGVKVDLKGYEGAVVLMYFGISGDTLSGAVKALGSVQDSDDGSTGWADLAATKYRLDSFLDWTGSQTITRGTAFADIDAAAKDDVMYKVSILSGAGVKRYIRALFTLTGTHTNGTTVYGVVLKGFARIEPAIA